MKGRDFCMVLALVLLVAVLWVGVGDTLGLSGTGSGKCAGVCGGEGGNFMSASTEDMLMGEPNAPAPPARTTSRSHPKAAMARTATCDGQPAPSTAPKELSRSDRTKGILNASVSKGMALPTQDPARNAMSRGIEGITGILKACSTPTSVQSDPDPMPSFLYFGAPAGLKAEYVTQQNALSDCTPPFVEK